MQFWLASLAPAEFLYYSLNLKHQGSTPDNELYVDAISVLKPVFEVSML